MACPSESTNRNGGRANYSAVTADKRAQRCRARPKTPKLVADPDLAQHVTARLEALDSPMTISIELARGIHGVTASVSHECIYQAVYCHGKKGLRRGLPKNLHRKRRCRKARLAKGAKPKKKSALGEFNPIASRPSVAEERSEVGHLEGDLITGAFNRSAIVTIFDRASRFLWMADFVDDHGADATLAAVSEILDRIPEHLQRTLTWDRGPEMARHAKLAELYNIDVYFADPHSPWQRPTNENGNGLIRRYVGKGTNLATYTPEDLKLIEYRINTMPRRSLGWSTAQDIYQTAATSTC